jgi:hypothetical protein
MIVNGDIVAFVDDDALVDRDGTHDRRCGTSHRAGHVCLLTQGRSAGQ